MPLRINIRERQGVTVLELNGKLIYGDECAALREQVRQLLTANKTKVVLHIQQLRYSDSAGLGCLVAAFTSFRRQGGDLKLADPSKRMQEVLNLTRLSTVFELYPTEDKALASFQ